MWWAGWDLVRRMTALSRNKTWQVYTSIKMMLTEHSLISLFCSGHQVVCQSPCAPFRAPYLCRHPRGRPSPSPPMRSAATDSKSPPTTPRRWEPCPFQAIHQRSCLTFWEMRLLVSCWALDEKIDITLSCLCIMKPEPGDSWLGLERDWKQEETAGVAQSVVLRGVMCCNFLLASGGRCFYIYSLHVD